VMSFCACEKSRGLLTLLPMSTAFIFVDVDLPCRSSKVENYTVALPNGDFSAGFMLRMRRNGY